VEGGEKRGGRRRERSVKEGENRLEVQTEHVLRPTKKKGGGKKGRKVRPPNEKGRKGKGAAPGSFLCGRKGTLTERKGGADAHVN